MQRAAICACADRARKPRRGAAGRGTREPIRVGARNGRLYFSQARRDAPPTNCRGGAQHARSPRARCALQVARPGLRAMSFNPYFIFATGIENSYPRSRTVAIASTRWPVRPLRATARRFRRGRGAGRPATIDKVGAVQPGASTYTQGRLTDAARPHTLLMDTTDRNSPTYRSPHNLLGSTFRFLKL